MVKLNGLIDPQMIMKDEENGKDQAYVTTLEFGSKCQNIQTNSAIFTANIFLRSSLSVFYETLRVK